MAMNKHLSRRAFLSLKQIKNGETNTKKLADKEKQETSIKQKQHSAQEGVIWKHSPVSQKHPEITQKTMRRTATSTTTLALY